MRKDAHRPDQEIRVGPLLAASDHIYAAPPEAHTASLEAGNHTPGMQADHAARMASVTDHALIIMDLSGQIIACNAGASAILGYADHELVGRSGDILFPAEDRAEGVFIAELCRAMEHGHARNERWHLRRDESRFWASGSMTPMLDAAGRAEGFLNSFRDNTAVRLEAERRSLLLAEMGHRLKNTLATVQAVAMQTLSRAGVPEDVKETFDARIVALGRAHDLLMCNSWDGASLPEIIERILLPYCDGTRASLEGPPVRLPAEMVRLLGLAFHELATNAAKYGALSVPDGRVAIRWDLRRAADGSRLANIVWREQGGPAVASPTHKGFGSRLLEQAVAHGLAGDVKLAFRQEGLECRLRLPVVLPSGGERTGASSWNARDVDILT